MDKGSTAPAGDTLEKTLVVQSKMGIHARPAAMIVRLTSKFKGEVFFEKDGEQVNGKSIMGLMMLAAGHGSKIVVSVQGAEGAQLVQALEELFGRKFDEA
jgi:phosphocarrier protein HPr